MCAVRLRHDAAHTTRKGSQRYRYYVCSAAQKRGWQTCPSKSIPAAQMEQLVIGQIQQLGRDPQVLHNVLEQVRQQDDARLAQWESERSELERDLLRGQGQVRKLLAEIGGGRIAVAGWCRVWPSCKIGSDRSSSGSRVYGRNGKRCSRSGWMRRRPRERWPDWIRPGKR